MADTKTESAENSTNTSKEPVISNGTEKERVDYEIKLPNFLPEKVLSSNSNRKTICVLGKFLGQEEPGLIIFEKNAFKEEELDAKGYFSDDNILKVLFQNDIYGNYECFPRPELNGVKTTVIYPATQKHIDKFSQVEIYAVTETIDIYKNITLPYIEKEQFDLQWVFNILEGTKEQERIIHDNKCETNGFVLLPDLKWDGTTKETLYLLAIVRRRGIKSLRDLDASHLELLKRIRDEGKKAIEDKYSVLGSQLRIYLHYQPSFYHLHVHFTYLKHDAPGLFCDRAHLIETVISNLELDGDYYKKISLTFTVSANYGLFEEFEKNQLVKRVPVVEDKTISED